jgi:hypothetical protein
MAVAVASGAIGPRSDRAQQASSQRIRTGGRDATHNGKIYGRADRATQQAPRLSESDQAALEGAAGHCEQPRRTGLHLFARGGISATGGCERDAAFMPPEA